VVVGKLKYKMSTPKLCLVVDIEATCWEKDTDGYFTDKQKNESEIIEIGITSISIPDKKIVESESIIVLPTKSEISEYCTNLTTLTPKFVAEHGITFWNAIDILWFKYRANRNMWASWGDFDKDIFQRQCQNEGVRYPFNNNYLNVKAKFCWRFGFSCSLGKALGHMDIPFEGTAHRGVDDSLNIAKLLLEL